MKKTFLIAFLFSQVVSANMLGTATGNEGIGGSEGVTSAQVIVVQLTDEGFTTRHLKYGKNQIAISNLFCTKRLASPAYEKCIAIDSATGIKIRLQYPHPVASHVVYQVGRSLKIYRNSKNESFAISKLVCRYTGKLWMGPAICRVNDRITFE